MKHIAALSEKYAVSIAANCSPHQLELPTGAVVRVEYNGVGRRIAPFQDLRALVLLVRLFRQERFEVVHSVTSKAGLLAMLASLVAGVPYRIHTYTGQAWQNRTGLARHFLKQMDWLIAVLATNLLADSPSQLQFLVSQRVVSANKATVLAHGSICGVDLNRFKPDDVRHTQMRVNLGLSTDTVLFLFLARITRDKGVLDLARAFRQVCESRHSGFLLVVGPDEDNLTAEILGLCHPYEDNVTIVPNFVEANEDYLNAADVLCLPSHREGFGNIIIEAAAVGKPAIGSRIYGIIDAIEDGVTGLLHEAGDVTSITEQMLTLINQPELRQEMGAHARERAIRLFPGERVTAALVDYYEELMK